MGSGEDVVLKGVTHEKLGLEPLITSYGPAEKKPSGRSGYPVLGPRQRHPHDVVDVELVADCSGEARQRCGGSRTRRATHSEATRQPVENGMDLAPEFAPEPATLALVESVAARSSARASGWKPTRLTM